MIGNGVAHFSFLFSSGRNLNDQFLWAYKLYHHHGIQFMFIHFICIYRYCDHAHSLILFNWKYVSNFCFCSYLFFFLYIIHKNSLMFYSHFQCVYNIYCQYFLYYVEFPLHHWFATIQLNWLLFLFSFSFFRNKNSKLLKMFKILQNTNFLNSLRYPFQLTFGKLWIFFELTKILRIRYFLKKFYLFRYCVCIINESVFCGIEIKIAFQIFKLGIITWFQYENTHKKIICKNWF